MGVKWMDLVGPRRPLALTQRVGSTKCAWSTQPGLSRAVTWSCVVTEHAGIGTISMGSMDQTESLCCQCAPVWCICSNFSGWNWLMNLLLYSAACFSERKEGVVAVLYLKVLLTSEHVRWKLRAWTVVHILDVTVVCVMFQRNSLIRKLI